MFLLTLTVRGVSNKHCLLTFFHFLLFSVGLCTVDRDLNQYKNVVTLFGAAYASPNIGTNNFMLIFQY